MRTRMILGLMLLAAIPVWAQIDDEPEAEASVPNAGQMVTPPLISNQPYPTEGLSEMGSNYITAAVNMNVGYIDNLYPGNSGGAIGETTFLIAPSIALDQASPRQHRRVTYTSGFTFYQPSSSLNEVDQNAGLDFEFRLAPHASINLSDTFQKSATSYPLSQTGGITGTVQPTAPGVVPPFAQRLNNTGSAELSWQFARRGMIGGSGLVNNLHFPNTAEIPGLYDSFARGGSAFYAYQLTEGQYIGATYQYFNIVAYPQTGQSVTETSTIYPYYTLVVERNFSLTVSGGPQYIKTSVGSQTQPGLWGPAVMTSLGWQGQHDSLAVSYQKSVTAGGGLVGAFHSEAANMFGRVQLSRTWSAGYGAGYASNKTIAGLTIPETTGGHTLSAIASVNHDLGRNLRMLVEYDRLHQSYSGVKVIETAPNSDRVLAGITWQFTRPMGR